MPVYLFQVGRKLHVFAVIHRDYDHAGHRLPEGFFQRGDEVGGFFHPVALAVHGLGQQLFADFCKSQFTQKVRGATAFLVLLCFLAFIQRIVLLQDLGKPVLGDIKYGNRKMNERTGTKTQALCAVRISFLDVPEENTLHYLSGKVIKLKDPQILQQFDALDKSKEA